MDYLISRINKRCLLTGEIDSLHPFTTLRRDGDSDDGVAARTAERGSPA
jgi:hypothetical protein